MARTLAWFSCGAASAVASRLATRYPNCEVLYCDTFSAEHPDNKRFFGEVRDWIGQPIKVLKSTEYEDIYDVFLRTRWLVGVGGARCTTELKKKVRKDYQRPDDVHVFGFTADEQHRVDRFHKENPELFARFPLIEEKLTKADCKRMLLDAGIELPMMYRLGYKNNNCIGCVKGQAGYWNKIRKDFPEVFDRMAKIERELNAAICKKETRRNGEYKRERVFLDELPPDYGRYQEEPDISCGVLCIQQELF